MYFHMRQTYIRKQQNTKEFVDNNTQNSNYVKTIFIEPEIFYHRHKI